jgi:hypothetical protein
MQKTLVLLALLGYSMAAGSLKHKLAQTTGGGGGGGSGGGSGGSGLSCSCTLPGVPGAGFPGLGSGLSNS